MPTLAFPPSPLRLALAGSRSPFSRVQLLVAALLGCRLLLVATALVRDARAAEDKAAGEPHSPLHEQQQRWPERRAR